jgi:glycosyltransferase involved in cell wall biosynthesis
MIAENLILNYTRVFKLQMIYWRTKMTTTSLTTTKNLISLICEGEFQQLQNLLFNSPQSTLEDVDKGSSLNNKLINHLDSLFFGTFFDALVTNQCLQDEVILNTEIINEFPSILEVLTSIEKIIERLIKNPEEPPPQFSKHTSGIWSVYNKMKDPETIFDNTSLKEFSKNYQWLFPYLKNQQLFSLTSSHVLKSITSTHKSLFPVSYKTEKKHQDLLLTQLNESKSPCILFMEPLEINWVEVLDLLENRQCLFVFQTPLTLFHCLQFPQILELITQPQHYILVLSQPLELQLLCQKDFKGFHKASSCFSLNATKGFAPIFQELQDCVQSHAQINLKENDYLKNSHVLERLKSVSRELHQFLEQQRLGTRRWISLQKIFDSQRHEHPLVKLELTTQREKEASLKFINKYVPEMKSKFLKEKPSVRLAHITSQLQDETSSTPTKIIDCLINNSNKNVFENFIFTTEYSHYRYQEYPYDQFISQQQTFFPHSKKTSIKLQKKCKEQLTPIIFDDARQDYITTAKRLAKRLDDMEVDVAVFHEEHLLNTLICRLCKVPLKVFYNHTSLPLTHDYDLTILQHTKEITYQQQLYKKDKNKFTANEYPLIQENTSSKPLNIRQRFRLPQSAKILATTCNHLNARLSPEMTWVVAEALRKHPDLYFIALGHPPTNFVNEQFKKFLDIVPKIIFPGFLSNPLRYLKNCDLYLNDFPIGGTLNVVEALSSNIPVISYFDPHENPKSHYAGHLIGKEHCFTTPEEAIDKISLLLESEEEYNKAVEHIKSCAQKTPSKKEFTQKFEEIIINSLSTIKNTPYPTNSLLTANT